MSVETREIRRVCGFWIGQMVECDGKRCEIVKFPSRQMVVVKRYSDRMPGDWTSAKFSVKEITKI